MDSFIPNSSAFITDLSIRFAIDLLVLIILIRNAKVSGKYEKDFRFSFLSIGMTVFFICFLLESVKLELGFALGLFAIFAILRYRTLQIPIKEMTYLFVIIGLSVINALANEPISYLELALVNVAFVAGLMALEAIFKNQPTYSLSVRYTNVEFLKEGRSNELHKDLEDETGLKISKVEVVKIDLERGYANLKVYVKESQSSLQFGEKLDN